MCSNAGASADTFRERKTFETLGATMTKHREVLQSIIDELVRMDPRCSISVLGSLARGEEREDSDIDIYVFLSREPDHFGDLIYEENRECMLHRTKREGIEVDVGWRLLSSLETEVPQEATIVPYYFLVGKVARDPSGALTRWLHLIQQWIDQHAWVAKRWDRQLEEVRRHKSDPSYRLQYSEKEFYAHIRKLVAERERK